MEGGITPGATNIQGSTYLQGASFPDILERLLGVVENSLQIAEPERDSAHYTLCCVTGEEHVVGVVAKCDQHAKLCLSEVLCFVRADLNQANTPTVPRLLRHQTNYNHQ